MLYNMAEVAAILAPYRNRSRGPVYDPIASVFDRILLGPGLHMTPRFMAIYSVTNIINCADPGACPQWAQRHLGPRYVCMDAEDTLETEIIRDFYPQFETTMDSFLRDPRCRKVYVHCQAGMNRSAALAIAYVHRRFGVPMLKLIDSVARQRPCILTNTSFQRQLLEFASHPKK